MSEMRKQVPLEAAAMNSPVEASQDDADTAAISSVSSSSSSSGGMEKASATTLVANSLTTSAMLGQSSTCRQKEGDAGISTGTPETDLEAKRKEELQSFTEVLQYIIESEETQKSAKPFFCKDFDKDKESDWTENHFLENRDKLEGDGEVILTKYLFDPVRKTIGWEMFTDTVTWFKIPCPRVSSRDKPQVTDTTDDDTRGYLAHIRDTNPGRFQNCGEDLNNIIPLLTSEDIPKEQEGWEQIRSFFKSAVEYFNSATLESLKPSYEKLSQFLNNDADGKTLELVAGFGHVRMVYDSKKNQDEPKIVNGALFEVPLQLTLQRSESGLVEISVGPAKDARITINGEVMAAIVGGGNAQFVAKLEHLVQTTSVESLLLENSAGYQELLHAAQLLSHRGEIRSANNPEVHAPIDLEALVITDAWCVFTRRKTSTVFSRDACKLIDSLNKGELAITEPIRALLLGPVEYKKARINRPIQENQLVYALPTSEVQRRAVKRLLVDGEPVFVLEGPPGTGKTHSIVNVAATALSEGMTVLVVSSNSRALTAFLEKLPKKLQGLALDMSCCYEDGMLEFQQALETLCENLTNPKPARSQAKLQKCIKKKKDTLAGIQQKIQKENGTKRGLIEDNDLTDAFEIALELSKNAPWLLKMIFTAEIDLSVEVCERIQSVKLPPECSKNDDILSLIEVRVSEDHKPDAGNNAVPTFRLQATMTESEKILSSVKVGERTPKTQADWKCVLTALKLQTACAEYGGHEADIFKERETGVAYLSFAPKLVDAIKPLGAELKMALRAMVEQAPTGRALQDQCRILAAEIQELESELLYAKVVDTLQSRLDAVALSALQDLCLKTRNLSSRAMNSKETQSSDKSKASRHFEEWCTIFKKVAGFMPFLVMTTEQVSKCLPADVSWGIGIMDETSQSNCTAITFMARCKQLLAVGDDKQVSPSQVALSEERVRFLKTSLPDIPTAEQLLPEYSFFDKLKVAFPRSSARLSEHYRCDPRIIAISNELFYYSKLIPLRLPSKLKAIEDKQVRCAKGDASGKSKKKYNPAEAEAIATAVHDEIKRTAELKAFETIGVISMGGPEQVKQILGKITEKIEGLIEEFGSEVVERHKVLVGTPQQFQGDERDIIHLSAVHDRPKKAGQKLSTTDKDRSCKVWNVALTRARNKMYLWRSFGIKDLKTDDIRQKILRRFIKPCDAKDKQTMVALESDPLVEKAEVALVSALKDQGYHAEKNGGAIWGNALRVDASAEGGSSCALLCFENAGETEEEWNTVVDQQQSLERAGRACLRVDCLGLVLNFKATLRDVLEFLDKSGLSKPVKRTNGTQSVAAATAASKKPRSEE